MSTSEKTLELQRVAKILAAIEAFAGRRSEVLARLHVDESVFAREERAFRLVYAQLAVTEAAALTRVYRTQVAALKGTRIEELGASTELVDGAVVAPLPVRFAPGVAPERIAIIRAAHPEDEPTAGGDDDTLRTPHPAIGRAAPWESAGLPDEEPDPAAETTIRARRPREDA